MVESRCLCGAVRWELAGALEWMIHCHCSRCRKAHGTAFATYAGAAGPLALAGAEHVGRHQAAGGRARCFCKRCGSATPEPGGAVVPAGNLLGDPGLRPQAHVFVGSKAPWLELAGALPRFEAAAPGGAAPDLPARAPLDPPGRPRGSCLCGAVAFVLDEPPKLARFCHCSRCRHARSAAFASNLFTSADGVRFTRGAERLAAFKVSDARYFRQVFCSACGSPMPRKDEDRDLCVVPMGALDDDPGVRPGLHIFVGSKAPWYEIADGLPQRQEL